MTAESVWAAFIVAAVSAAAGWGAVVYRSPDTDRREDDFPAGLICGLVIGVAWTGLLLLIAAAVAR